MECSLYDRWTVLPAIVLHLTLAGNNLQVTNLLLDGKNTTSNTYDLGFDVSWENSWRTTSFSDASRDAAWLFAKFRVLPAGDWQHAVLLNSPITAPSGSALFVTSDQRGAFLYRSAAGLGNVNFSGAKLRWDYGANGVADNAVVEVRVMGVEMVHVPFGTFFVGDGSAANANQFESGQSGAPYQVTSEDAITLGGNGVTSLNARNNVIDDFNYSTTQSLPAGYPKGFAAFYAMKYELTEGQYVDFLNLLTPAQRSARFPGLGGTAGHGLFGDGAGEQPYYSLFPERAMGGISFSSGAAYADWSGLRPLSELEYEKICRGPIAPVPDEFAWGTADRTVITAAFAGTGTASETIMNPGAGKLANQGLGTNRPWRGGIVPASFSLPTRVQAASGYSGAMDLSGNLAELVVSVNGEEGRGFLSSAVGNGALDATGNGDVPTWPVAQTSSVRACGGHFQGTVEAELRISHRRMAVAPLQTGLVTDGIRLGRP